MNNVPAGRAAFPSIDESELCELTALVSASPGTARQVAGEFDYFAHCVLTDTDCETDCEDGQTDLRVFEAAYESAARGERISL